MEGRILRARGRALESKRILKQEHAEGQQDLLRHLYHLMTQTSGMSAPASFRAGDESPELQAFLNQHGFSNPRTFTHPLSPKDIPFSPSLVDPPGEDMDLGTPEPLPSAGSTVSNIGSKRDWDTMVSGSLTHPVTLSEMARAQPPAQPPSPTRVSPERPARRAAPAAPSPLRLAHTGLNAQSTSPRSPLRQSAQITDPHASLGPSPSPTTLIEAGKSSLASPTGPTQTDSSLADQVSDTVDLQAEATPNLFPPSESLSTQPEPGDSETFAESPTPEETVKPTLVGPPPGSADASSNVDITPGITPFSSEPNIAMITSSAAVLNRAEAQQVALASSSTSAELTPSSLFNLITADGTGMEDVRENLQLGSTSVFTFSDAPDIGLSLEQIEEHLPQLINSYAQSIYPLPVEVPAKKRKKEAREKEREQKEKELARESGDGGEGSVVGGPGKMRYTTSGAPVVDMNRWEATMRINPVTRWARKASKCLSTREWQVMYHETRLVKCLQRVHELKLAGSWSFRQPKKSKGPTLYKVHHDYLLDEMQWLAIDYQEERKWKKAVAYELAHTAARYVHGDDIVRGLLTNKWPHTVQLSSPMGNDNEIVTGREALDAEEEDRVKEEVMDMDTSQPSIDIDDTEPRPTSSSSIRRTRRTIASHLEPHTDEDEDEDSDSDDDDDRLNHGRSPSAPTAPPTVTSSNDASAPAQVKLEEHQGSGASDLHPSQVFADMQDAADAKAAAAMTKPQKEAASSVPASLDVQQSNDSGARQSFSSFASSHVEAGPSFRSSRKGLKPGRDDVALSSTAGSLLDPKLLRGPIFDLPIDDRESTHLNSLLVNLSELYNKGLSQEDRVPSGDVDRDDIKLADLFPELTLYEPPPPPASSSSQLGDKKEKRIDEAGGSSGRLTATHRLTFSKNVLLSSLNPAEKYHQGVWDDPSDAPIWTELRDSAELKAEAIPPCAPMFSGSKARDHVHPTQFIPPPDPVDRNARLANFVWTPDEDQLLRNLFNIYGLNWTLISEVFNASRITIPTDKRLPWDCFHRWLAVRENNGDDNGPASWQFPQPNTPKRPAMAQQQQLHANRTEVAVTNAGRKVTQQLAAARAAGGRRNMRHAILFEIMKKNASKRAASKPQQVKRGAQIVHDTHIPVSTQKPRTPAELSRMKYEQDETIRVRLEMETNRRRAAELARHQAQRTGQPMQMPIITQQPRMAHQGVGVPGPPGVPQGPSIPRSNLPVQHPNALLQAQHRAQQLNHQAAAAAAVAQANGGQPNQLQHFLAQAQAQAAMVAAASQVQQQHQQQQQQAGAAGSLASPIPIAAQQSSPHSGPAVPNGRPPSTNPGISAGSPQLPFGLPAGMTAQAVLAYRGGNGLNPPIPQQMMNQQQLLQRHAQQQAHNHLGQHAATANAAQHSPPPQTSFMSSSSPLLPSQ